MDDLIKVYEEEAHEDEKDWEECYKSDNTDNDNPIKFMQKLILSISFVEKCHKLVYNTDIMREIT